VVEKDIDIGSNIFGMQIGGDSDIDTGTADFSITDNSKEKNGRQRRELMKNKKKRRIRRSMNNLADKIKNYN
jgi:hypothetical protein